MLVCKSKDPKSLKCCNLLITKGDWNEKYRYLL